jgi:hypothetical protein
MLKTVVVLQTVVVGSVSVLLALTSQPPAQPVTAPVVVPSQPAASVSTSTDVQETAEALKALEQAQSKIVECTFALKMKEMDPDFDSRIKVESSSGAEAKIRRVGPIPCRNLQVQHRSMSTGQVRIKPAQKK